MPPIFAAVKILFQSREPCPDGDFLFGFRRPALNVHGNKAAGIFGEIFGGVVALRDGGNLELKLDEFGIEKAEQNVVGTLAIDGGELEVLVVKALLDAGFGGLFAHFVVLVGGALHIVHGGMLGAVEAGHEHLGEANVFGPGDATGLILAEFIDAEVRADASDAGIGENFAKLRAGIFGEASEARIVVANGRAEFHGLKSSSGKLLDGAGKILGDHFADGPGLATDGEAERIGAKPQRGRGKKGCCDGGCGGILEESSSGDGGHGGSLQFPAGAAIRTDEFLRGIGVGDLEIGAIPMELFARANGDVAEEQSFGNEAFKLKISAGFCLCRLCRHRAIRGDCRENGAKFLAEAETCSCVIRE